ncbi:ABC transporter substrate-binding protein [Natrialba asiatica]|uniref:Family 5 extracellular solute-binding protein n=1 Tax=Natrialba asiatica (strain ATCC 700177 / DSM 12278 / JCM 9576 / FERM P-10747 / NBRC 102637 / 172P1) TaxID=29540 RepID=M0AVF0_NATA1|nr:ABC transporter substrate-binding protein [Natrialba asiatica]ELZ01374.1 family 5 extracellular solute-binding protein [Natrialba asiatica DSM 12278]
MTRGAPSLSRRHLLAGASGLSVSALAGCAERFWSRAENNGPDQVALTIKTVPADDDAMASMIVSRFRENVEAAGIDVSPEPITESELYRDVLLEGEYDVFVIRHPGFAEFDDLYGLLHSQFVSEGGWQNPFHFSSVTADDFLEQQRAESGETRRETLAELFEYLTETTPFTVVAYPDRIGGTRRSIDAPAPPQRAIEFIDLLSTAPAAAGDRDGPLTVGIYGDGLTGRLNPIAVDQNRIPGLLDLVYAPLVRRPSESWEGAAAGISPSQPPSNAESVSPEEYIPWLADDVRWDDTGRLSATVSLRPGLTWHDGEPLDADDVAFTFRLLADTSLGTADSGIPAPRYRGRQTLVDTPDQIEVVDGLTLEIPFGTTTAPAAAQFLTVPILPQHIWEPRSELVAERQTRALTTNNDAPVGSGLLEFGDAGSDALVLEPVADHVLRDSVSTDMPAVLDGFPQFEGLRYNISPNVGTMVDALLAGDVDVTASPLPPEQIESLADDNAVSLLTAPSTSMYLIGYNTHHPELGNPNVRRILSRLIDREYIVSELFDGLATAPTTQESLLGYRDSDDRSDPLPLAGFPGTDGELDVERVRRLFDEIGYRYEDGVLLR